MVDERFPYSCSWWMTLEKQSSGVSFYDDVDWTWKISYELGILFKYCFVVSHFFWAQTLKIGSVLFNAESGMNIFPVLVVTLLLESFSVDFPSCKWYRNVFQSGESDSEAMIEGDITWIDGG